MNRNLRIGCIAVIVVGLLLAALVGGYWLLSSGLSGGESPTVRLIQPAGNLTLRSGQGLVVIVEGQSQSGLERIEFYVDGQLDRNVSAFGETSFQASIPWFGTTLGDHELRAVGYDRRGRASQPAAVIVRVQGANVQEILEGAMPLDPMQSMEEIVQQVGGGQPGGGQPGEGQPAEDNQPPVAELTVIPVEAGNAVSVTLRIRARDNVAMDAMSLTILAPDGTPEFIEYDCEGNLECSRELERPLAQGGVWVFTLDANDRAGLPTEAAASVFVICNAGVDANNQPFMNCALAGGNEPPAPLPGEPPAGDGEPPSAELVVTPMRNGNAVAAVVEIRGRDNAGLNFLQLITQAPNGVPEIFALGCEGAQECGHEFVTPLADAGSWIFVLNAVDLAGQSSPPQFARVEVICDANGDCAVADEEAQGVPPWLEAGGGNNWWQPGENPVFEPLDPIPGMFGGQENAQNNNLPDFRNAESFMVNGCEIRLPVAPNLDPPNVTECPNWNLRGVDLRRVDLDYAIFQGSDFTDAALAFSRLRQANLSNTILKSADFNGAVLAGANLSGVNAVDANFLFADLSGGNLIFANLHRAVLANANLSGANLSNANLSGSMLTGANLSNATLVNVDFSGADLSGVHLAGADLTGVIWNVNTICPDGSGVRATPSCEGHLIP